MLNDISALTPKVSQCVCLNLTSPDSTKVAMMARNRLLIEIFLVENSTAGSKFAYFIPNGSLSKKIKIKIVHAAVFLEV